jgi:formylglycine-generating enzyme required for sulfatase activity
MRQVNRSIALLGLLLACCSGSANNLTISQPFLLDFNNATGTVDARFTISWQNSWRTTSAPANWDAAWVFLKFRVGNADPARTGVSSTGTTLNVGSTAGLRVGMPVLRTAGTGAIPANAVITAIPNATQVTISAAPTTALAGASVRFIRIWEHARLANDAAHFAPAGSTIRTGLLNPAAAYNATTNYGVGAFIHRSANGTGTFTANNVELRWNHGTQGLNSSSVVEVCAFAHEMVYVTAGSFRVGDGAAQLSSGGFYAAPALTNSYLIASEAAITVGTANGNLHYGPNTFQQSGDQQGPVPVSFPKGTLAFYAMKYEITQGDYMNFLNRCTRAQQAGRVGTNISTGITAVTNRYVMSNSATLIYRNGIRCPGAVSATDPLVFYCDMNANGIANEAADGQWVACNYMNWADLAAFLDWSGLRPFTELEFEKTCRGPLAAVPNECAWGSATVANALYTLANNGRNNEQVSANYGIGAGNAAIAATIGSANDTNNGPLRVGIFAAHGSNSGRVTAGAGYYGALELSGNVQELTITIGAPPGRAFTGVHGDGQLSELGVHNAAGWPAVDSYGTGPRGGPWIASAFGTSWRAAAAIGGNSRTGWQGGRGVRSAP